MKLKLFFTFTIIFIIKTISFSQSIYCTDSILSGYLPNEEWYTFPNNATERDYKTLPSPEIVYRLTIVFEKGKKISNIQSLIKYINTTELFITGDLDNIPDEIFSLKKLKKISLTGVESWDWDLFFKKLSNVKQLESLEIFYCSFVDNRMPKSICLLKQLKRLEIYQTWIQELPDSFNLNNLCYLKIKTTDLFRMPKNFKSDCLEYLEISDNRFNGVPKQIANFKNLKTLDFRYNTFFLEDTILLCKDKELSILKLDGCGIEDFPIGLRGLPKLETLTLTCNRISFIPDGLLDFKNLKTICLTTRPFDVQLKSLITKMPQCKFSGTPSILCE
jgi:Leucine-rich repeat (LRR) protein